MSLTYEPCFSSNGRGIARCGVFSSRGAPPPPPEVLCGANLAHVRQSRPDSGRGCQTNVLKPVQPVPSSSSSSSSSLLLSSLELSDTKVYEPQIRALLGIAPTRWGSSTSRSGVARCGVSSCRGWRAPPEVPDRVTHHFRGALLVQGCSDSLRRRDVCQ